MLPVVEGIQTLTHEAVPYVSVEVVYDSAPILEVLPKEVRGVEDRLAEVRIYKVPLDPCPL